MISIVIPVLDEVTFIDPLMAHLSKCERSEDLDVIFVDGGSTDGSIEKIENSGARFIRSHKGRALQMNVGAAHALHDILFFLHADSFPPFNFVNEIQSSLIDEAQTAGCFPLTFDKDHPILKLYSALSRLNLVICTFGDQGLFLKKSVFKEIGGFKEICFLEDIEIQKRLRRYGPFQKRRLTIQTSARKFEKRGVIGQQMVNVFIVLMYLAGASPKFLNKLY